VSSPLGGTVRECMTMPRAAKLQRVVRPRMVAACAGLEWRCERPTLGQRQVPALEQAEPRLGRFQGCGGAGGAAGGAARTENRTRSCSTPFMLTIRT
jgi:hypothetical protein